MASLADMLSGSFDSVEKAGKTPPLRSLTEALLEYALQQQHPVNDPSGKYSDLPYPGNPNFRPMDKYETPGADEVGASGLSTLTRSLYPFERNTRTGEYRGAMPQLLQNLDFMSMADAAKGDLQAGLYPDRTELGRLGQLDAATNLSGMLTLGGGAIPKASNTLGIFGGTMAKTANHDRLNLAIKKEAQGAYPDEILDATGWFRGTDGKWRFEIDDSGAQFSERSLPNVDPFGKEKMVTQWLQQNGYPELPTNGITGGPATGAKDTIRPEDYSAAWANAHANPPPAPSVPLSRALQHSALFEAYPEFANIPLAREHRTGFRGSFDTENNAIATGGGLINDSDSFSTTLHELQHAVQTKEGFAAGGNAGTFDAAQFQDLSDAQVLRRLYIDRGGSVSEAAKKFEQAVGRKPSILALDIASSRTSTDELFARPSSPTQAYKALAGEVEARNVQARQYFDAAQRQRDLPWHTQDTPTSRQIVRFTP